MHSVPKVCHRDLKPQNILVGLHTCSFRKLLFFLVRVLLLLSALYTQVDPLTHQVKICDFGSAKVLVNIDSASFCF